MFNNVYQVMNVSGNGPEELMALAGLNGGQPEAGPAGLSAVAAWPGDKWLIQSCGEDGLNVCYQLCIVYPRGREFQLTLPWLAQEVCPSCQGQGVLYRWSRDNSYYEASPCEDCQGEGSHHYDSEINITVNDGLGGQRVIRKRQAGRFNAQLGLRGDLIINITWVEELPAASGRLEPPAETSQAQSS